MKRSAVIELTALLDVIMILMFLVLTTASQRVEEMKQDNAGSGALEQKISQLQNENSSLLRRLDSFTVLEQNCLVITLSVTRGETSRTILLECKSRAAEHIDITWDGLQYAKNTLSADLNSLIKDAGGRYQVIFIVFQYDRNSIYQTDYRLVNGIIQSEKQRENIYCAEYDILEDYRHEQK